VRDHRFRVLLISRPEDPVRPPPLSFWFLEREDAEMVAALSAVDHPAGAVLGYAPGGQARILRFHGAAEGRAALADRLAAFAEPEASAARFFASSGPAGPAKPVDRIAAPAA
jgi:hypothetical protein